MTPTLSITVDVIPTDHPKEVMIAVSSVGAAVTAEELVKVLRSAADHVEAHPDGFIESN